MKKILFLMLVILASCSVEIPFHDYQSIMNHVNVTLSSRSDMNGDDWQTPEETEELKTGDCEDHSIYMLKIVYDTFGVKGQLAIIYYYSGKYEGRYHAIVFLDKYYDPAFNESYSVLPTSSKLVIKWDYDTAMFLAEFDILQEVFYR